MYVKDKVFEFPIVFVAKFMCFWLYRNLKYLKKVSLIQMIFNHHFQAFFAITHSDVFSALHNSSRRAAKQSSFHKAPVHAAGLKNWHSNERSNLI